METIAAFGDSVLKGVVYENDHYRVTDMPFYKRCEEVLGIVVENKAKFGSTIKRGEAVFDRYLESLKDCSGKKWDRPLPAGSWVTPAAQPPPMPPATAFPSRIPPCTPILSTTPC